MEVLLQNSSTPAATSPTASSAPAGKREDSAKPGKKTKEFAGSAEEFIQYTLETVPRTEVAAALASSGDELHKQALNAYMQRFYFAGNALDAVGEVAAGVLEFCRRTSIAALDDVLDRQGRDGRREEAR
jgi:hypothetical protein